MVFCPFFQDLTEKTGLHPIMADVTVRIKICALLLSDALLRT